MEHYLLSTPENSYSSRKQLLTTENSLGPEDCPYCQMKRKFNIGSHNDQRCLQHSIRISIDENQSDENESNDPKAECMSAEEMKEVLEQVESNLDYYWDNLREISGGNPATIHKKLQPVLCSVKRVQQKISKFFVDNTIQFSEVKLLPTQATLHRRHNTGSQRFFKADISNIFDPEDNSTTESIKEWVMHFYKILQLRQQPENIDLLSHEEDLQMRIFKQSMERKFLAFANQISKYEKKVKDTLTKLIFYMEKSSENVSEKQIEEDILFIQGQQTQIYSKQTQLQRILLQNPDMDYLLDDDKNQNRFTFNY